MEKFKEKIKECLQHEPAFCTAVCPFRLDVRDFMEKMQRGGFNAAYRAYLNTVTFPVIVSELCGEPCKGVCPRGSTDAPISMKLLEKASIRYARNLDPNSYNLPDKGKSIAVIGAGISGLACALRMASKKYRVTVYEKSDRIGGHLWKLLPSEIFLKDIRHQFMNEEYTLCLNTEIKSLEEIEQDAVYIATGAGGTDFGLERSETGAYASVRPGFFIGGSLCGSNTMEAIADGLQAVNSIERYLKTGNMNQPTPYSGTKIKLDSQLIKRQEPVIPAEDGAYTTEEAVNEAKRCLRCSCDACIRHCDLMKYYSKYPKRIGEEVEITIHPGTLDGNGTVATRLIATCNHCGICKEVCPLDIDTGEFLLQSHRAMREKGAMPWAYHDFWLRDMHAANGESAALCRIPEGYKQSSYVFFPGCQLGASEPSYVMESYRFLLKNNPDTALMLGCCGVPAEWAGDEPLHRDVIDSLREKWEGIGKPIAVFACPTCKQVFEKYLPEIKGVFLYQRLGELGIHPAMEGRSETVSVFDPCTSRYEPELQQGIRDLAVRAGFNLEPLPYEGKYARCCSWGGQVSVANPAFAREVVKVRTNQGNNPYIAYCVNCRDIFAAAKKPVYHILDILFGLNGSRHVPPTITERRHNRIRLKRNILKEFWREDENMGEKANGFMLYMTPELRNKLNNEMILEGDVQTVIEHCENSGKKVAYAETGHYIGHLQIGNMTCWAEYVPRDGGFELFNAYSHRMSIEEG